MNDRSDPAPTRRSVELAAEGGRRHPLLWAWTLVVVLYFAWEAAAYRGIFAYLAEWQFDHIGQDLPSFNFSLLVFILTWPALLLIRRRQRRPQPVSEGLSEEDEAAFRRWQDRHDADAAIEIARDFMHFLYGLAIALSLAAVAALLWTLALPNAHGTARPVAVTQADPPEGPAVLSGEIGYGRIASFSRGILFVRRSELYAPVLGAGGRRDAIRYFVEFSPYERAAIGENVSLTRRTGILVRSDLPGALVRLYRYLGYLPAKPYYVLYASPLTIRWPYYIIAAQFVLGALLVLAAGLLQRRRIGVLDRQFEDRFRHVAPVATLLPPAEPLRLTAG